MKLLLDTHALVWWLCASERLSDVAKEAIDDASNDVYLSAASAWEIATKVRLGKMSLPARTLASLGDLPEQAGFVALPVSWRHAVTAGGWIAKHRDPFDRLLAAQCKLEQFVLVTVDPAFSAFRVKTLW